MAVEHVLKVGQTVAVTIKDKEGKAVARPFMVVRLVEGAKGYEGVIDGWLFGHPKVDRLSPHPIFLCDVRPDADGKGEPETWHFPMWTGKGEGPSVNAGPGPDEAPPPPAKAKKEPKKRGKKDEPPPAEEPAPETTEPVPGPEGDS